SAQLCAVGQLAHAPPGRPRAEDGEQMLRMLFSVGGIFPGGGLEICLAAVRLEPLEERRPVAERRDEQMAVEARDGREEARPMQRSLPPRDLSILMPEPGDVLERPRYRGLQAHVDELPTPGGLTGPERGQGPDGGEDAGLMVRLQPERTQRGAVGMSVDED